MNISSVLKVSLTGVVDSVKTDFGNVPLLFSVASPPGSETPNILVRWRPNKKLFSPRTKKESFEWVNENLEETCRVEVNGFARITEKGGLMINAVDVRILSHPDDSEDLEETRERDEDSDLETESDADSDDRDFDENVDEESSSSEDSESEADSDDRDFDENVDEESSSEEDSESEADKGEDVLSDGLKITDDIHLKSRECMIFHGQEFPIKTVDTLPGRVTLLFTLGEFHFDRMDKKHTSVTVPPTRFEPHYRVGYTILTRVEFRKILEVLY